MDTIANDAKTDRRGVYFFWDYDLTEEDVRAILREGNEVERIWVMGRILQSAHWHDIWTFLKLQDVRDNFGRIQWRTPYLKELWLHALEVWSRD
ncbi:MAG: hypothetical protein IT331_08465 [Anaerolineae bacterium]|nr:hypothetical protein [Anaerolineae bacterium]